MIWASPYERATACTGSPRPGARALLAWALETYRGRGAHSLGIYNCRTVVGGSTTSTHGEGRAVDLGLPLGPDGKGTPLGRSIVAQIGAHGARLGVQAIVYDRTVWSSVSPSGRRYDGAHPHYDHLHIELTRQAADRLTLATFRHVLGGAAATRGPLSPSRMMSSSKVAAWQHRIDQLPGIDCAVDGDFGPKTVVATKAAQKLLGLGEDGEVHAAEWALLISTLSSRDLGRHAKGPHGGDVDLSGYAEKDHAHEGTVTVR